MTRAFTVWLTGLPGSGKTTVAGELAEGLRAEIGEVAVLDGDIIRRDALYTLGFERVDRDVNIRALAFVAKMLNLHGVPAIVAAISPYEETRLEARKMIGNFFEVHVDCPVEVCIERDPKGLYKRALAGEITMVTGIDDPYEAPSDPECRVRTDQGKPSDSARSVVDALRSHGHLGGKDLGMGADEAQPSTESIPMPPEHLRTLVGGPPIETFDNPTGGLVFPEIPADSYEAVFDFGCGCGRTARRLLQQTERPKRYLGIDLHKGVVDWCQENLTPVDPAFQFIHHDATNIGLNPGGAGPELAFPSDDAAYSLVVAESVFTHLIEDHVLFYLDECVRILRPGGRINSTWFLFDKRDFPMMQQFQNALYINTADLTNAVIYDRAWFRERVEERGLRIEHAMAPGIRGFQWRIILVKDDSVASTELPDDTAEWGIRRPPVLDPPANQIR